MAVYKDLGITTLESFKCFILDNKMNNLSEHSVLIKTLLYHLIYKERYYTHKTRAKLNHLISVLLSNVDYSKDPDSPNTLSLLPIDVTDTSMKYWNLSTLQQDKRGALNLLRKIYDKFEDKKYTFKDFVPEDNSVLLPLIDVIKHMARIESNAMFQNVSNEFYIMVKSVEAFEDVSETDLETLLGNLTSLNVFFTELNDKGNKNTFSMKFKFIVSEGNDNADQNSKLNWLSERINLISSDHCKYTSTVESLPSALEYFEFKDFVPVDPRVVFQGDLIFNTNTLDKTAKDYLINRIPVLGYPAIKKLKPQAKALMHEAGSRLARIKQELAFYHKETIAKTEGVITEPSLEKEKIVTVYKNGDCYSYLNESEMSNLTTMNVPVEKSFLDIKKEDEEDDDEIEEVEDVLENANKHTLFNKSIVPLYTMDKQQFPVEYLTGESQIITCDFYSNKTPVNKANYLAFISFVDLLLEQNMVSIGRYVKKETAPYDVNLCCLSPSKTILHGKENRCLIITRIIFGAENKYLAQHGNTALAERLPTKKQKISQEKSLTKGVYGSKFASMISKNTLNIKFFDNNDSQLFVKDRGDPKQWEYRLKLDQHYPCTHVASALNEKKVDALSLDDMHSDKDVFRKEMLHQTSSEIKDDLVCYNNFDLKKIYDLEMLRSSGKS